MPVHSFAAVFFLALFCGDKPGQAGVCCCISKAMQNGIQFNAQSLICKRDVASLSSISSFLAFLRPIALKTTAV